MNGRMVLLALFGFYISGCASAELVSRVYEPEKSGVVRYKNSPFMGEKNRVEAEKEMSAYCGGPYRIVREDKKSEFSGTSTSTTSDSGVVSHSQDSTNYLYLTFVCK